MKKTRAIKEAKEKYEVMRAAILKALKGLRTLTHTELFQASEKLLPRGFKGSKMVLWQVQTLQKFRRPERKGFVAQCFMFGCGLVVGS